MKRNTFYIFIGIIALIEVGILWLSIQLNNALLIQAGFVAGVMAIYLAKRSVTEVIEDERTIQIAQKASMRTLEIFWILFFIVSIGSVIIGFNRPFHIRPPPPVPAEESLLHIGWFGFGQLALLCLMLFLYVAFRIYYARKYGEWETDEE